MSQLATLPDRLEDADRHAEVFRLRIAGHDFPTIAAKLGYASKSGPYEAIKAELKRRLWDQVDDYRNLLIARDETIWRKVYAKFEASDEVDLDVVDTLLKILDRMAKHAGIESPKAQVNVNVGQAEDPEPAVPASTQDQLQSLLEKLRARAAAQAKPLDVIDHQEDAPSGAPSTNGHNGKHHEPTTDNG